MTRMRIEAAGIAALGQALTELADTLEATPDARADQWAFGSAQTFGALNELVGGWRRERLRLIDGLFSLGSASQQASGAYVETEAAVSRSVGGETR